PGAGAEAGAAVGGVRRPGRGAGPRRRPRGAAGAGALVSVLVAAVLDAGLEEPPVALHPVVWSGRYLEAAARRVPAEPRGRAIALGGAAWTAGAVVAVAAAVAVDRVAGALGRVGGLAVRGAA